MAVKRRTGTLWVRYRVFGTELDVPVRLVTTRCKFGGVQWWLACPSRAGDRECGRRVATLYYHNCYFACRHCHGLTYASTQRSDARVRRFVRGGLDFDAPDRLPGVTSRS